MGSYTPLTELLLHYETDWLEEKSFKSQFQELLLHPRAFHRDHLPGHITGSAWVTNPGRTKVLLHHHVKLNKWLQAGGHADGDENVLAVALRELEEETGIKNVKRLSSGIFDLDIHPIPTRKDFPEHLHFDVRFCFEVDEGDPLAISNESFDVKWISLDALKAFSPGESLLRMAEKSRML